VEACEAILWAGCYPLFVLVDGSSVVGDGRGNRMNTYLSHFKDAPVPLKRIVHIYRRSSVLHCVYWPTCEG